MQITLGQQYNVYCCATITVVRFIFYFFLRTSSARGGGGVRCQTFSFSFFPCSADHERDWPPCKVVFFGLATNALNVRNNNNNNNYLVLGKKQVHKYVHLPKIVDKVPINGESTGRGRRLSIVRIESEWAERFFAAPLIQGFASPLPPRTSQSAIFHLSVGRTINIHQSILTRRRSVVSAFANLIAGQLLKVITTSCL